MPDKSGAGTVIAMDNLKTDPARAAKVLNQLADLLDGVVPDDLIPILQQTTTRDETIVALRNAAAQMTADIPTRTLQVQSMELEAEFLERLAENLSRGMSVYGALVDVACVLRLGFEEHIAHLNAQFKAGRYALSEILDGVISVGALTTIRTGEKAGDLVKYLSRAAETLATND